MKRKVLGILLALGLTAVLAACGGGESGGSPSGGQPSAAPSQSGTVTGEDGELAFIVSAANNYAVKIDADMADVLAALGEPQSYFEAASCAFEGLDKTYTYTGFTVTTRPDGDKDYVNSILLTDDSVTTPEGVYIGAPAEDVLAAYGEGGSSDAVLSYVIGNTALNFIMQDGAVISIEYIPAS